MTGLSNERPRRPLATSSVEVNTSAYEFAHGRKPRGTGGWAFIQGGDGDAEVFWFFGSYTEAKRAAQKWAAQHGWYRVEVGS